MAGTHAQSLRFVNALHTRQIMRVFDTNGDGDVDYEEFRKVVGSLLMPGMEASILSSL
jgi:Ca2+-binding EF-hand superfamily protein